MNCNSAARCYFTVRGSHANGAGLVILFQAASENGGPLYKQGSLTRSPRNFKHHYKLATHYSTYFVCDWDWMGMWMGIGMDMVTGKGMGM